MCSFTANHEIKAIFGIMVDGHWQPGIGDPSIIGWVTVGACFITAFLCCLCLFQRTTSRQQFLQNLHNYWLWGLLAVILLLLGLNKQLDLQSWLTEIGRDIAQKNGWYNQRRNVQIQFIVLLGINLLLLLVAIAWLTWKTFRNQPSQIIANSLALGGLTFLICFVLLRAASFHHIDRFISADIIGIKMNWLLELSGIFLIAAGACWNLLSRRITR